MQIFGRRSLLLLLFLLIFSGMGYLWLFPNNMVENTIEDPMKKWPPASCNCPAKSSDLVESIPIAKRADVQKRRAEEYKNHQARTSSSLNTLLFAPSNSPLQYPIQGFTVRPLVPTLIPGLALHSAQRSSYKVLLNVTRGVLSLGSPSEAKSIGGGEKNLLILETLSLEELNKLLGKVTYTSTVYHIHTGDLVHFLFEHHEAVFPIVIRQPALPVLYDLGTSIKTKGWFAGRNLAVSQVTTKYFLWVDDDFLFTDKTKIEDLVEVMEAIPELDVVGGSVTGNQFYFSIAYEEGDGVTGGCLDRKSNKKFQSLPNYPQCSIVNGVVNFFLARTDAVNRVRFDPKLKRVAHSEFFMDGLGQLMVASCGHVSIDHQPRGANAQYGRFRHPGSSDVEYKLQLHYYKNHLKCIHYG